VQAVLDAAYSVIGTPYQWGGASPETGFDCSGFTMWSWAHAGVSLPHSSAAQYSALPHVAREDLQPGDLLFFYSPISHVAMYVGGGRMIHASHPGVPVGVVSVYWDSFVGAARPG
jgi:cell wall-associated NlpC family hydrolase